MSVQGLQSIQSVFTSEKEFEDNVVAALEAAGWDDGTLVNYTEEALLENFAKKLFNNNKERDRLNDVPLTSTEIDQVLEQIRQCDSPLAINRLINGRTISIKRDNPEDKEHLGKEISLKIYDRREIAGGKSTYQIARQPRYKINVKGLDDNRRGDITLLINGLPVIHIELKRSGVSIHEAEEQIKLYLHNGVFKGFFSLAQIFVAMNPDEAVYFANPGEPVNNTSFHFHWADKNNEPICDGTKPGQGEWKRFVEHCLHIPEAHKLIGFYTIPDSSDNILKVLRSYQCYAAEAICDKVHTCDWENIPKNPGRPGGYIWHTTGSGKTMTSFKSAQLISDSGDADKVIFLMDRIELGTQSLAEYKAFADDESDVQGTENTYSLKKKLMSSNRQDRLIVTSIQKMSNLKIGEKNFSQHDADKLAQKRIVIIVDECHRSTFGDMLQDIRRSFYNAMFFGFTGTPILEENQKKSSTTSMIFGDELHRYTIADGIRDKNVLAFDPYMVLTYPDDELRDLVACRQTGVSVGEDLTDKPEKRAAYDYFFDKRAVPMAGYVDLSGERHKGIEDYVPKAQYSSDDQPHKERVCHDICRGFHRWSYGGKFHAIFATSSISEAIDYYHLFKKKAAGKLKVTALFDPHVDNDEDNIDKQDALLEIIDDYNRMYGRNFILPTWHIMKKDIAARLAHKTPYTHLDPKTDQIDILIVVDQMLTGFDSKWVNMLFLDKVIQYENLIQAFSRTNRIFGPEKPHGIIRYYRYPHTMKQTIEEAVKLYSGNKPQGLFVDNLIDNILAMERYFNSICMIFAEAGIEDFMRLPEDKAVCRKFASEFRAFSAHLHPAKIQGFDWNKEKYESGDEWGDPSTAEAQLVVYRPLDERTYRILLQRYRETITRTPTPPEAALGGGDEGFGGEIATGLIDDHYINSKYKKWMWDSNDTESQRANALEELLHSFATLSEQDQYYAQLFIEDVKSGAFVPEKDKTFREYLTLYTKAEREAYVDALVLAFGIQNRDILEDMMSQSLKAETLRQGGQFDELSASVNKACARQFFEQKLGRPMSVILVKKEIESVLSRFILEGAFDIYKM